MKNIFKKTGLLMLAFAMCSTVVTANVKASNRVEDMINRMTLRQKITQMLMVDFRYWDEDVTDSVEKQPFTKMNAQVQKIVEDYDFGAIIYFAQNIQTTEDTFQLSMDLQKAATKDNGIPLLISADQEGGSVYRLGSGTALPGNMALGATGNSEYARNAGQIIGSELSVLGINTNLAPVVDVNNNANNPVIGLRSYGDDAAMVGEMASKTIQGLAEYNVIGCAKHFPGHGDTATDSHYGLPSVDKSKDVLLQNELKPYEVAIDQGIEMIMTAHILYPQLDNSTVLSDKTGQQEKLPATMSKAIITDLLKGEMGFSGIVCTDAMNMQGVSDTYDQVQAVKLAINAGVDMICMPCVLYDLDDLQALDAIIDGVETAVNNNEISEERLNDAVRRILTVKEKRGILDWSENNYSLDQAKAVVGSKDNRELERKIAAKAVTVVKNENEILPLNITENSKVLMMCPYDNEKAQMIMGWNRAKEAGLIPAGAQVKVVRFSSADLAAVQTDIDWADTIVVHSEISNVSRVTSNHWLYAGTNAFVNYAKDNGKNAIVISVDKPYDVQFYDKADAIMAVYGCKGSSVDVTEALVGGVTGSQSAYGPNIIAGIEVALGVFGASGKLPVSIPKLEGTSYSNQIVYARGYGLSYHSKTLDFDVLKNKIEAAKALSADDYTAESYQLLMAEVEKAEALLSDMNVTQAEIDQQVDMLDQAIKALVSNKKDDTNNDQNKPPKDETNNKPGNDETTKKNNNPITNTGAPQTGSSIVIYLLLGAMFIFFKKMDRIAE
ncbi:MAG: glycoside hydrolase family 3 protein [Erysipelotrichaceae bacterium]|nr:glycoside hydrolase family 3 protein [Erysipelotrichaceae bacterium]